MGIEHLTDRERTVAFMARRGASSRDIAAQLYLSPRTVETHLGSIYRKLGVTTRAALIALLHEIGGNRDIEVAQSARRSELFVGRDAERGQIERALLRVRGAERAAVLIGGEPGVGKSALVRSVTARAAAAGAVVLAGNCDPSFGSPFGPVADALRPHLAGAADPGEGAGPGGGALGLILPELVPRLPAPPVAPDTATARRWLVDAIHGVLVAAGRHAPVVLVLEDLHWADEATLGLLGHLVAASDLRGVLPVGTFRNTELRQRRELSALLAGLWREPSVLRFDLDGLSTNETADLARLVSGERLDEQQAQWVRARTGGNPFFLLQLLGDAGADAGTLPRGIGEVVFDRARALGDDAVQVLEVASVLGSEFSVVLLASAMAAASMDTRTDVGTVVDRLVGARLLTETAEPGRLRFAHDLVRESMYDRLGMLARASLHLAAGNALLDVHGDRLDDVAVALATHFDAATALGEQPRAAEFAVLAAHQAMRRLAPRDALALAGQGLANIPARTKFDRLLLDLTVVEVDAHGALLDHASHREATLRAIEVARRIGDPVALGSAVERTPVPPLLGSSDQELLAARQEALDGLGSRASALRARLLASSAYQRSVGGDGWAAVAQAEQAVADGRALGDTEALASGLFAMASATRGQPDLRLHRKVIDELLVLGERASATAPERDGRRWRGMLAMTRGDRTQFEKDLAGLAERADRTESTYVRSTVVLWSGLLALLDGRFDAADDLIEQVGMISRQSPNFMIARLAQLAQLRTFQDRAAEVISSARALVTASPSLPVARALAAGLYAESGDLASAYELIAPLFEDDRMRLPGDWLLAPTLCYLADLLRVTGTPEQRRAVTDELAPYAGQVVVAGAGALVIGAIDHYRGIVLAALGETDAARAALGAGLSLHEQIGAVPLATLTRIELAACSDDPSAARDLLRDAAEQAHRIGMSSALRRISEVSSSGGSG